MGVDMTHTPGPWGVHSTSSEIVLVVAANGKWVVVGDHASNIALIKSAPALLAALKDMLAMYGPRGSEVSWDGPCEEARAAVAQAEDKI